MTAADRTDDPDDRPTAPAQEGTMSNDQHGTSDLSATQPIPSETSADARTDARTDPAPWEVDATGTPSDDTGGGVRGPAAQPGTTPGPRTSLPAPVATELRVGTVVWGLVLAAIGVGLLAAAFGVSFDVELAVIGVIALAGVGLVVGTVVTGVRRGRRTQGG